MASYASRTQHTRSPPAPPVRPQDSERKALRLHDELERLEPEIEAVRLQLARLERKAESNREWLTSHNSPKAQVGASRDVDDIAHLSRQSHWQAHSAQSQIQPPLPEPLRYPQPAIPSSSRPQPPRDPQRSTERRLQSNRQNSRPDVPRSVVDDDDASLVTMMRTTSAFVTPSNRARAPLPGVIDFQTPASTIATSTTATAAGDRSAQSVTATRTIRARKADGSITCATVALSEVSENNYGSGDGPSTTAHSLSTVRNVPTQNNSIVKPITVTSPAGTFINGARGISGKVVSLNDTEAHRVVKMVAEPDTNTANKRKSDEISSKEVTPIKEAWRKLHGQAATRGKKGMGKKGIQSELQATTTNGTTVVKHLMDTEASRPGFSRNGSGDQEQIRNPRQSDPQMQPPSQTRQFHYPSSHSRMGSLVLSRHSSIGSASRLSRLTGMKQKFERVQGFLALIRMIQSTPAAANTPSLPLIAKLPIMAGSLTIESIEWPILISPQEFIALLEDFFVPHSRECEDMRIDKFFEGGMGIGDGVEDCGTCSARDGIVNSFTGFVQMSILKPETLLNLHDCWSSVVKSRKGSPDAHKGEADGSSNGSTGSSDSEDGKSDDWVSVYVTREQRMFVRRLAEVILKCIEEVLGPEDLESANPSDHDHDHTTHSIPPVLPVSTTTNSAYAPYWTDDTRRAGPIYSTAASAKDDSDTIRWSIATPVAPGDW